MPANDLIGARLKRLGSAKVTLAAATTTSFDFGTPDDLNLAALASYSPGDRIVAVFDSSTAGATDTVSFVVQDAPDNAGAIGTPAAAVTDGDALTGGTGDRYATVGVRVQPGRPWLRFRATSTGATDTHVVQVSVFAVPPTL